MRSGPTSRYLLSIQPSSLTNANASSKMSSNGSRFLQPTRNASSSKNKGPSNTKNKVKDLKKAPEINFDHRQGNSILHQKAARAAELHAELNTLLESQAQRRADEANRHFGAGFLDFVKSSKSELINIFAAFTCVLLAWQIAAIRKGARRLLDDAEEKNEKMEEFKQVLRVLSSDEFLERIAGIYREELKEKAKNNGAGGTNGSVRGWFGKGKRNNVMSEVEGGTGSNDILTDILKRELIKVIGDKVLTSAEIEEKRLRQLQREMGLITGKEQKERIEKSKTADDSLGGLEQVFMEVQKEDVSGGGGTIVKRSKGFI